MTQQLCPAPSPVSWAGGVSGAASPRHVATPPPLFPPFPQALIRHPHGRGTPAFSRMPGVGAPLAVFASLNSVVRLRCGEQLHALAAKSGLLASNPFVGNPLLASYSRAPSALSATQQLFDEIPTSLRDTAARNTLLAALVRAGYLDRAQRMLDEMAPGQRDTISYTTIVSALARASHAGNAVRVFCGMLAEAVPPNEVTLVGMVRALAHQAAPALTPVRMALGVAVRRGLDGFVIVTTNLVHPYAATLELSSARFLFEGYKVTWNVMLNGYTKTGCWTWQKSCYGGHRSAMWYLGCLLLMDTYPC